MWLTKICCLYVYTHPFWSCKCLGLCMTSWLEHSWDLSWLPLKAGVGRKGQLNSKIHFFCKVRQNWWSSDPSSHFSSKMNPGFGHSFVACHLDLMYKVLQLLDTTIKLFTLVSGFKFYLSNKHLHFITSERDCLTINHYNCFCFLSRWVDFSFFHTAQDRTREKTVYLSLRHKYKVILFRISFSQG